MVEVDPLVVLLNLGLGFAPSDILSNIGPVSVAVTAYFGRYF